MTTVTTFPEPIPAYPAHAGAPADVALLLNWLHRLLAWQIALTRRVYGPIADDSYRGLYIPSAEADILADEDAGTPPDLAEQRAALAEERAVLEVEFASADREGADLPLYRLGCLFGLDMFARDVLLLALAPELDSRYERIYAYIQDDVSRRRPSIDLALRLLCTAPAERLSRQDAFEASAPLMRHRLLLTFEDGQRRPPLIARFLKLDDRIAAELRRTSGDPPAPLDALLTPFAGWSQPARQLDDLVLPADLLARLRQLVAEPQARMVIGVRGGYGSGRRALAEALCTAASVPLLTVDLERLPADDAPGTASPDELLERAVREAALRGAALFWRGADRLLADDAPVALRTALLAALDAHGGWSFLALEQPWEARGAFRQARYLHIELPHLSYSDRERIWRLRLGADCPDDATLAALASTFRLTAGQIRDAARTARDLTRWRGADGQSIRRDDLYAACRAQSSGRLAALAHKIPASYTWSDIVLPSDQVDQLREIVVQVRHRRTVLERWGFDKHLATGKGVNVLFAGPSGTGKTMAAEIIAADLGLELYKIDLSTMVSKYIGETEKNLDRVFTAAREANAILFFDEADALFGKRSEVRDAHDRYANIEVGYLLQKMEEYDGVVILATNLRKNLDEAFVRRLHMAIDFPFPEEGDRLRIWRKVFPADAPLERDVNLEFLARQFKLAGGNIRNAALLAAFLAAEDGAAIGMEHILRAVRREYQKIGKLAPVAEFEQYRAQARNGREGA
ncbi:MAG: ATP-binding protein [Roseiflexus sp.]|nr:ATP-binding protein [Roseiflexus sp.]